MENQEIAIKYYSTNDMWTNLLIKALIQPKCIKCCIIIGLTSFPAISPQLIIVIAKGGVFNGWIGKVRPFIVITL